MSEMIDRVALAIWQARDSRFPARVRRPKPDDLDRATGAWQLCQLDARAALNALREPSSGMNLAGGLKCEALLFEGQSSGVIFTDMGAVFTTMIDAALMEDHA